MRRNVPVAIGALLISSTALGASLLLGPEWVEDDKGDAGPLPSSSQTTTGNDGDLSAIKGTLEGGGLADGAFDVEDMFLIRIVNPENFCATTDPKVGDGAFAQFDSRLYLFKVDEKGLLGNDNSALFAGAGGVAGEPVLGACCLEDGGCVEPVTQEECEIEFGGEWQGPGSTCDGECNTPDEGACCLENGECLDDISQDKCKSLGGVWQGPGTVCGNVDCLDDPGTSTIGNMATDGSGAAVTEPGLYYLAICTAPRRPISPPGVIFQVDDPFEVSGPDGVGGNDPIEDWEDQPKSPPAGSGEYRIVLCGTSFAQSICLGDLNLDFVVDSTDLAMLLAVWGNDHPTADFNGDDIVNHHDLAIMLGAWGDCFK